MTNFQKVEPWELLNLAFMPREEALEVADRYAAQLREEQKPKVAYNVRVMALSGRELWNSRCKSCRCETPVFLDNSLCPECDPPRIRALKFRTRKV